MSMRCAIWEIWLWLYRVRRLVGINISWYEKSLDQRDCYNISGDALRAGFFLTEIVVQDYYTYIVPHSNKNVISCEIFDCDPSLASFTHYILKHIVNTGSSLGTCFEVGGVMPTGKRFPLFCNGHEERYQCHVRVMRTRLYFVRFLIVTYLLIRYFSRVQIYFISDNHLDCFRRHAILVSFIQPHD